MWPFTFWVSSFKQLIQNNKDTKTPATNTTQEIPETSICHHTTYGKPLWKKVVLHTNGPCRAYFNKLLDYLKQTSSGTLQESTDCMSTRDTPEHGTQILQLLTLFCRYIERKTKLDSTSVLYNHENEEEKFVCMCFYKTKIILKSSNVMVMELKKTIQCNTPYYLKISQKFYVSKS